MKSKRPPTAQANLGLAYKYAQKFCPPEVSIEDTETYADACIGLVKAERDYDVSRLNPATGKPYAFSTCAWQYMRTECATGHRDRSRSDRLQAWHAEEEWQFGITHDESDERYVATPVVELLKKLKLKNYLALDLEMLLVYHLEELTLKQVGERYGVSKERIRQRIGRVAEHILATVDYAQLEELADVCGYRDGLQRWWKDDFNSEVLSRSSAA
tara:strand:- start:6404 stop:7045 length:642 start_codon:yes stop_codon:yes gene_type:complete